MKNIMLSLISSKSAKCLNTQEKEASVKNYKIYQFYFTTSFFLVILRVI